MTADTDAVWDEISGGLAGQIADDLRAMVRAYDAADSRTLQRDLGPSQIGNPCTYHLAALILGLDTSGDWDDPWCRILGTAGHGWLEEAAAHDNNNAGQGRWLHEIRVHPDDTLLPSGGKADLYDARRRAVVDHKIVGVQSQRKYKANGPGRQYRAQAHLYGKGCVRAGFPVDTVAIAFWLRGGRLSDLHVWTEPYDEAIADAALARYATLRALVTAGGAAVLPSLPRDPDCWDCKRAPATPEPAPRLTQTSGATGAGSTTTNPTAA